MAVLREIMLGTPAWAVGRLAEKAGVDPGSGETELNRKRGEAALSGYGGSTAGSRTSFHTSLAVS